jgi:hypothetical protein
MTALSSSARTETAATLVLVMMHTHRLCRHGKSRPALRLTTGRAGPLPRSSARRAAAHHPACGAGDFAERDLWNVWPYCPHHSGLMPANLTTLAHFSDSAAM